MKIAIFAIACSVMVPVAPAFAGAFNGADVSTVKYTSTKCNAPADPGLLVSAIKSRAAFTNAATAYTAYKDAYETYRACRTAELNADAQTLNGRFVAEEQPVLDKLIEMGNALIEKQKTVK